MIQATGLQQDLNLFNCGWFLYHLVLPDKTFWASKDSLRKATSQTVSRYFGCKVRNLITQKKLKYSFLFIVYKRYADDSENYADSLYDSKRLTIHQRSDQYCRNPRCNWKYHGSLAESRSIAQSKKPKYVTDYVKKYCTNSQPNSFVIYRSLFRKYISNYFKYY